MLILFYKSIIYGSLLWGLIYILSIFFDKINPQKHEFDGALETNFLVAFLISLIIIVSIRTYLKYKKSKQ